MSVGKGHTHARLHHVIIPETTLLAVASACSDAVGTWKTDLARCPRWVNPCVQGSRRFGSEEAPPIDWIVPPSRRAPANTDAALSEMVSWATSRPRACHQCGHKQGGVGGVWHTTGHRGASWIPTVHSLCLCCCCCCSCYPSPQTVACLLCRWRTMPPPWPTL